jgi:NAD(P)-dependent dehydrogenase (short-subunit alcohol dehydrogenase family)
MAADLGLDGKVVIVTGAGRGIGRGIARVLAEAGAAVTIAELRREWGEAAVDEIASAGGRARFAQTDVTDDASARASVDGTVAAFGRLDILVNNAALTLPKGAEETEPDEWDRLMATNLKSCYLMSRHAIPAMRSVGGGSIVHVSSWHARSTIPRFAAYAASKGGIDALTRQMALDCGKDRIRVNAVAPGIIDTPMWHAYLDSLSPEAARSALDETLALQPLGRIGTAEDVAHAVLFLASDLAASGDRESR